MDLWLEIYQPAVLYAVRYVSRMFAGLAQLDFG